MIRANPEPPAGQPGNIPADLAAAAATPSAGAGPAAGAPAVSPVGRDWKREAADIVEVVASLRHVFPSLAPIYTPQTCSELANAWAPILERHDIDLGRFMIYFTAAGVTLPVAVATQRAIRADIRNAKGAVEAIQHPTVMPPGASPSQDGAGPAGDSATRPDVVVAAPADDPDLPDKPNVPLAGAGPAEAPAAPIS